MSSATTTYPAYVALAASGELAQRAEFALRSLRQCQICPRACRVDRSVEASGVCGVGCQAVIANFGPHHGEEDCLKGWRGSGTIFLSGCSLGCVFCQNWEISHEIKGRRVDAEELAACMLQLQERGCHNLNWVTPTHVVPQLLAALVLAVDRGLRLPIVYNSGGYDAVPTLRWLDGVVDLYMPDVKFWDPRVAERLGHARDYPEVARQAVREMHRQVGDLVIDKEGLARRGVLIRHLVMPNDLAGTIPFAHWLASEISPDTFVNLMDQYHPAGRVLSPDAASGFDDLIRPITREEFDTAMDAALAAGLRRFDHRQPTRRGWFL